MSPTPGFAATRWSKVMLWFILFFSVYYCFINRWKDDDWKNVFSSDGVGYYSYLPATFIYHDFSYSFLPRLAKNYPSLENVSGVGLSDAFNGKRVNKYFVGEAVALTPFFLAADVLSGSDKHPADGFSFYYAAAVGFAAIFYLLMGLWCIRKLLLRFGIKEGHVALVLFFIFFATNLFRYALAEQAMSHIYSFGFISCFILQIHILLKKFSIRRFLFAVFILGMIIIIRPVNILVVLIIPFLAADWKPVKLFFAEIFRQRIVVFAAIIFAAVIFLQLYAYHIQCGKWMVYAYNKEGFNFLHPHFFSCLFSYSNGMFVYAPVLLIAFAGIFTFYTREKFRFFSFLLFFIVLVWIISSWWAWTYGGAFGMRPLVEYYSLFALLLGILIKTISQKRFAVLVISFLLLVPLTAFCQLQLWQYDHGIIGYDQMSKEKYWRVFLETRRQFYYINIEGDVLPVPADAKSLYSDFVNYEMRDSTMDWRSVTTEKAFSGTHAVCLKSENNHAPAWKKRAADILPEEYLMNKKIIVSINSKWLLEDNGSDSRIGFLILRGDSMIYYADTYIIHQVHEENKWTDFKWNITTLPAILPTDTIKIFPRRDNWFPAYMDDLDIKFYSGR